MIGTSVTTRTQIWMSSDNALAELSGRANGFLASLEATGGSVTRCELLATPIATDVVFYTVWIQYQERIGFEED